jgi:hypothetical protein
MWFFYCEGLYTQSNGGFFFREILLPDSFFCRYLSARLPIFTPQLILFDEIRNFYIDPSNQLISENNSLPVNLLILHAADSAFWLVFNHLVNLLLMAKLFFIQQELLLCWLSQVVSKAYCRIVGKRRFF